MGTYMPDPVKKTPAPPQKTAQAGSAAAPRKGPATPVPSGYPPRPGVPRKPHAQPVPPKSPPQKAPAQAKPQGPLERSPSEDILELEDIVSALQTQDPEPLRDDEPLFDFDEGPAIASDLPAAPDDEEDIDNTSAPHDLVQSPKYERPVRRVEFRTSGARFPGDPIVDGEPFFNKTTLIQAALGTVVLMFVFLAGVYVGSTPSAPEPKPEPPSVALQPQVQVLSTAAVRNLGAQPADFGPTELAKVMIRFLVEQPGRDVYVLKYTRGGEPTLFTVDFPNQIITQAEGVEGSGILLTWKGFVLERLRAAAQGQNFEMTPKGEIPASLQRF